MANQILTAKTSTVNQSTPRPHLALTTHCKDLDDWPGSWMGIEKDIPAGEKMAACFGLAVSRKTVREHVENLWVLGGALIRKLHETPPLGKRLIEDLVFDAGRRRAACLSPRLRRATPLP